MGDVADGGQQRGNGEIFEVQLTKPGSPAAVLLTGDGFFFGLESGFSSLNALNTAFGSGSYRFVFDTENDLISIANFSLAGDYPATPRVSNFTAAQSVNPAADFIVRWDTLTGGTIDDLVELYIYDSQENEVFADSGGLDGTSTSEVVPANTLMSDQTYRGEVRIWKIADINATEYPGAFGFTAFYKTTEFTLKTGGQTVAMDVSAYGVVKGQSFRQADAGVPALDSPNPYLFNCFVDLTSADAATNATLQLPGGSVKTLDREPESFFIEEAFSDPNALELAYPDGNYMLTIYSLHDGVRTITLNLSGGTYPPAPHLSSFDAAQAINPTNDFAVSWDAFAGGTADDFVQLQIEGEMGNTLFGTGSPGDPAALNGTSLLAVIPADTLSASRTYQGRLLFGKGVFDTMSYPGAVGVVALFKETQFGLRTTGGGGNAPAAAGHARRPRVVELRGARDGFARVEPVGLRRHAVLDPRVVEVGLRQVVETDLALVDERGVDDVALALSERWLPLRGFCRRVERHRRPEAATVVARPREHHALVLDPCERHTPVRSDGDRRPPLVAARARRAHRPRPRAPAVGTRDDEHAITPAAQTSAGRSSG